MSIHIHREGTQVLAYLLFLVLSVFGDKESQTLVDSPFLDELFKLFLNGDVKSVELRTDVKTTAFPVSLGGQFSTNSLISVVGEVVDDE